MNATYEEWKAMSRMTDDSLTDRLHAEADLCRNETATDIADMLDESAAVINHLRTALTASEARVRELEREIERIIAPVESGGGVVAYIRDRAEAAESRLADLLEGLEGVVAKWREGDDYIYCCLATELQSLLTQNTPPVNSVEAVNKETLNGN